MNARKFTTKYFKDGAKGCETMSKQLQNPDARRRFRSRAKLFRTLGNLTRAERYAIFDLGIYNDVLKGYAERAASAAGVSEEIKRRFLSSFSLELDTMTAEQAENYHRYREGE